MNSPVVAVGWEVWSRNRWALGAVGLGLPLAAIPAGEWFRIFQALYLLFAIAILFWSFIFAEVDARGRHAGFPSRMFVLPARTLFLAGLPMMYGACTISLFYLLWSQLVLRPWGVSLSGTALRIHMLTLVAMLLSLQAIVWSFYRFPWIRLGLLMIALPAIGALGFTTFFNARISQPELEVTLAVTALLAVAGGVAGVSRDRRGEWDGRTQSLIERVAGFVPRGRAPLASAADAQLWFEWRGKAMFSCAVLLLGMLFPLLVFPVPTAAGFDAGAAASFYVALPTLMLVCAWALGFNLARTDYWSRNHGLSSFVTTRPLSSGDIVLAKFKAAALVVLTAWLLFAVFAVPAFNVLYWCFASEDHPYPSFSEFVRRHPELIRAVSHPVIVITAISVMWTTALDSLSLGLKPRRQHMAQSIVRIALVLGLLILVAWMAGSPTGRRWLFNVLPWATSVMILWKAVATVVGFVQARRLYSTPQFLAVLALWLAAAGVVIWAAFLLWTGVPPIDRTTAFLAAWLAPGAALARAPVNLARSRHA